MGTRGRFPDTRVSWSEQPQPPVWSVECGNHIQPSTPAKQGSYLTVILTEWSLNHGGLGGLAQILPAQRSHHMIRICLLAALVAICLGLSPEHATCSACTPAFCGDSNQCEVGCFCAKPMGSNHGICMGS